MPERGITILWNVFQACMAGILEMSAVTFADNFLFSWNIFLRGIYSKLSPVGVRRRTVPKAVAFLAWCYTSLGNVDVRKNQIERFALFIFRVFMYACSFRCNVNISTFAVSLLKWNVTNMSNSEINKHIGTNCQRFEGKILHLEMKH